MEKEIDICANREAWEPRGLCGTLNDEIMCRFSKKTEYDQSTTSRYAMAIFCPNCCRPLTEEAWAELEKRVRRLWREVPDRQF